VSANGIQVVSISQVQRERLPQANGVANGLVMIESLACGTPVIAFHCGSVPEGIEHGRSGRTTAP